MDPLHGFLEVVNDAIIRLSYSVYTVCSNVYKVCFIKSVNEDFHRCDSECDKDNVNAKTPYYF